MSSSSTLKGSAAPTSSDSSSSSSSSVWSMDLNTDGWLLFIARFVRLFSYGWLCVALMLYLVELGYSQWRIGILFTGTILGDLVVTFFLTTTADSYGRRNTLMIGALLKIFAGVMYAFTDNFVALLLAGTIGVISPTGGEIGPFLAVEQSSLTETITRLESITVIFGWYQFVGYIAQALGALCAGLTIMLLQSHYEWSALASYRFIVIGYATFGLVKLIVYYFLSTAIEPLHARELASSQAWFGKFGLHRSESRAVIFRLSLLFILDAFGGGFVMQTIIVYWFAVTYSMGPDQLGTLLMAANIFAGLSALAATPLVKSIGAISTMVFTHFPSNILLILVPLMPNQTAAVAVLLARFCISQMDVPARQTYVALVVDADERSAAGGITSIVRCIGMSVSPLLAGYLLADPHNHLIFGMPFIIAGGLKCLYDILLYISFKTSSAVGTHTAQQTTNYTKVGVNASEIANGQQNQQVDLYDEEADQNFTKNPALGMK